MGVTQEPALKDASKGQKRPGENGFKYRQKYGLVVVCDDEAHQQKLFKKLSNMGLRLKVVCV
jgi:hypothetical protein